MGNRTKKNDVPTVEINFKFKQPFQSNSAIIKCVIPTMYCELTDYDVNCIAYDVVSKMFKGKEDVCTVSDGGLNNGRGTICVDSYVVGRYKRTFGFVEGRDDVDIPENAIKLVEPSESDTKTMRAVEADEKKRKQQRINRR